MSLIDERTPFGQRVLKQLAEERVIWLTSVSPKGMPQPTPVWFWWDGETFLIYSQPDAAKIRNIRHQPQVALNFNSDFHGNAVTVFRGTAVIDPTTPPANQHPDYLSKYTKSITAINMTPASFSTVYNTPIHITPHTVRGH